MHYYRKLSLLLVAALVGLVSIPASAQSVGNCEPTISEQFLDINQVRAKVLNNGNLFWNGGTNVYEVPKGGGSNAIFASGIWMGGLVDGQLRLAGSTYGPFEFWAGPLNDDGTPPADCEPFDRIYKISKEAIVAYESSGSATPDLADWPTGLGAPTLDAEGNEIDMTDQPLASRIDRKINLAAGERPAIKGDQMMWFIMNDRGNQHTRTDTPPMGVEVHGSVFAFNTAGAIGNTTFYSYRIFYKGSSPLTKTYMGLFSDPDLGAAFDDYVGSDTTRGIGFVYNADNDDDGNYGDAPPASGYDFFQGPLVNDNGIDDNGNGEVDEDNERLKMTAFVFYNNGGGVQGDPGNGTDMYNYMQARWRDGQRMTFGGDGRNFSTIPTNFMFPGDPPEFWSEFDSDGNGTAIAPADRRFVMASGPFTIQPNGEQEIVFGIVTSFGSDNLDSVQQMKSDDALAQQVFDIDFELPSPPAGPRVSITEMNKQVLLEWGYNPTDNNYLDSYNVVDPLLSEDVTDNDYILEGYNVFQYSSTSDQTGKLLATYDRVNGITRVIEGTDLTFVTAEGSDRGLAHSHLVDGLTNYTTYEFGIQAYAYNATSGQKVYAGPVTRVAAVPSINETVVDEDAVELAQSAADIEADRGEENIGNGGVTVNVVNPVKVTGSDYRVEFFNVDTDDLAGKRSFARDENVEDPRVGVTEEAGKSSAAVVTTYSVVDVTSGETVFDGETAVAATGNPAPQGDDVVQFDGLSMNVSGAPNDWLDFKTTANAAGPISPPDGASAAWEGFPGTGTATAGVQQSTNDSRWHIATGQSSGCGDCGPYSTFISRSMRNGWDDIVPKDFEIRFTDDTNYGWDVWTSGGMIEVPFQLWDTGIATPDDPSDDVRLIPIINDADGNAAFNLIAADHTSSSSDDDPYTDWIYWYTPADGETYDDWEANALADPANVGNIGSELIARLVLYSWNGADPASDPSTFIADMPESGTVFRMETTKPNQPGDTFAFSTDGLGSRAPTQEEQVAALDEIGITPNPYKGASAYEVSQLTDQVRFTNMPDQATIRVFSLSGSLITTLVKNSPDNMFPWDLTTEEDLPIASGMYIIHIESDLGEKVLKFGVVKKRVQLNVF